MPEVVCIGDILMDMVPDREGVPWAKITSFSPVPGGSVANVSVGLARLGVKVGFIGKVGKDAFGELLVDSLAKNKVDVSQVRFSLNERTTLGFVCIPYKGKNDFIFYRGAEMKLLPEEVNEDFVVKSKILHTGSISITCEPCYSAVLQAIHLAHKYEVFVSFDPNLRPSLWSSLREAKDKTIKCINGADLVKMNEEELRFFTGKEDLVKGARWLLQKGPKAVVITQGNKGSFFYNRETLCFIPGYKVKVADTLGCGDAFTAAIIYQILLLNKEGQNISFLSEEKIRKSVEFANAAGALAATGKGAIPSLPTAEQVKEFLSKRDVQVI